MFASHITSKCVRFYSYQPDPYSAGVDAFSFRWVDGAYAFPPFNMITKTINKIINDKCNVIVVAPLWKSQPWFPMYMKIAVTEILTLGPNKTLMFDPYREKYLYLSPKLTLMVAVLSGRSGLN